MHSDQYKQERTCSSNVNLSIEQFRTDSYRAMSTKRAASLLSSGKYSTPRYTNMVWGSEECCDLKSHTITGFLQYFAMPAAVHQVRHCTILLATYEPHVWTLGSLITASEKSLSWFCLPTLLVQPPSHFCLLGGICLAETKSCPEI